MILDLGNGATLQVPDGVDQKPEQGVDSIVGSFSGEGFTCQFDHGLYASDLSEIENRKEEAVVLDGLPARLVSAPPDFDALHVPETKRSVIGSVRLTVTCRSETESARKTVREILSSLKMNPAD